MNAKLVLHRTLTNMYTCSVYQIYNIIEYNIVKLGILIYHTLQWTFVAYIYIL
jgi:hypothetical protein